MKIGVLGLQGAVREHVRSLEALGADVRVIKSIDGLHGLDGLVLPGGESTAMSLLGAEGVFDRLRAMVRDEGLPVFGTCAGMILLAGAIEGGEAPHLNAIDITVSRNASGRQVDSFETVLRVEEIGDDVPAVFIRAPFVVRMGSDVVPMAWHEERVVMARQGNILVASFHPELTDDLRIHRYFLEQMVDPERKEG